MSTKKEFKGAIFDLDGVVVDTVPIHFKAWKRMFSEYGKYFSFEDYKAKVDGIPRIDGGRAVLEDLSDEELIEATDLKQKYFREYLSQDKIPIFNSTIKLIKSLKKKNVKVAVISSSKNSPYILEKIGLIGDLDAEISGNDITKGKPNPEIFLMAAKNIGFQPTECVVFEDAVLGVKAAKRAKMVCIGIDRHNDPERLKAADLIVKDLNEISYDRLTELFRGK